MTGRSHGSAKSPQRSRVSAGSTRRLPGVEQPELKMALVFVGTSHVGYLFSRFPQCPREFTRPGRLTDNSHPLEVGTYFRISPGASRIYIGASRWPPKRSGEHCVVKGRSSMLLNGPRCEWCPCRHPRPWRFHECSCLHDGDAEPSAYRRSSRAAPGARASCGRGPHRLSLAL